MASTKSSRVNPKYKTNCPFDRPRASSRRCSAGWGWTCRPQATRRLCRRAKEVELPGVGRHHPGPVHLIVDSTGLKVYGAGEWCSRKHR